MNGSRLTVQFARGSRQRDFPAPDRTQPRPRRTAYRMQITGLPGETSWQVSFIPLPSLLDFWESRDYTCMALSLPSIPLLQAK